MAFELVQRHQDAAAHNMPAFEWKTGLSWKHGDTQKGDQVKQSDLRGDLHEAVNEELRASRQVSRAHISSNDQHLRKH